ncbi:MAG: GNAT family N-acetyltransferase [Clostridiales bacterium]|jgi:GNAT superfamily N-acetyltransferase|nr:GNAT family N-acetyltransferase [Clostridiales bacterium]
MCEVLGEKDFLPEGDKGGFPSDEMVKNAIAEKDQFIGIEVGQIVAAYIMNHDCDEAYHTVRWLTDAEDKEMVVLHALRVLPEYGGRGYSKQLVQHAIDTARERGLKSIRLDCIEGNDIPQKMYMSFGFAYVDTVEITYVDIGIPRKFLLYEFAL